MLVLPPLAAGGVVPLLLALVRADLSILLIDSAPDIVSDRLKDGLDRSFRRPARGIRVGMSGRNQRRQGKQAQERQDSGAPRTREQAALRTIVGGFADHRALHLLSAVLAAPGAACVSNMYNDSVHKAFHAKRPETLAERSGLVARISVAPAGPG